MAHTRRPNVLHSLMRVPGIRDPATDGSLLRQYLDHGDQEAFAILVRRHGPMVLRVCRRALALADAEDAFQATFLLLVRKARTLRQPEQLGPWLFGVAHRTALKTRALASARRRREQTLMQEPQQSPEGSADSQELRQQLDEAIASLGEKYQAPFHLCVIQGKTQAEASRLLGLPPGTIATRLSRARSHLQKRLLNKGIFLSPAVLLSAWSSSTLGAPSPALVALTVRVAASYELPRTLQILIQGGWNTMMLRSLRLWVLTVTVLVAVGVGTHFLMAKGTNPSTEPKISDSLPQEEPHRTLPPGNFVVVAPTEALSRLIAREAEQHRKNAALIWQGKELPPWNKPCRIQVSIQMDGVGGSTTFTYHEGKVNDMQMNLRGNLEGVLVNALPHEVTHTVLADILRRPLPRWADEGAALLSESPAEQEHHLEMARRIFEDPDRRIPLQRLLPLMSYPADVMCLYAEGYALTRFLVRRKDRVTFLGFLKAGIHGEWVDALRSTYGFNTIEELEEALREDLALSRPQRGPAHSTPLPKSPAPRTALALVETKGMLTLRLPERKVFQPLNTIKGHYKSQKLTVAELSKRLSVEQVVVVSTDGRPVDPFFLQVLKEDVLVLVIPELTLEATPSKASHK